MDKPLLDVRVTAHGVVTVLKPVGWLTSGNSGLLDGRIMAAVDGGAKRFVVDLSSTHFTDNSGLAVFAAWKGRLDDMGGCLVLASPGGSALRALTVGRLHKYLPVCESVAEAVEMAKQRTESGRWKAVTV